MEWSHSPPQPFWVLLPTAVTLATLSVEGAPGLVRVMGLGVGQLQLVKVHRYVHVNVYSVHPILLWMFVSCSQWYSTLFHCVGCGQPDAPLNGRVTTPGGTAPGNLAHYECNIGYNIDGLPVRFCLTNDWVPKVPACNSKNAIYA